MRLNYLPLLIVISNGLNAATRMRNVSRILHTTHWRKSACGALLFHNGYYASKRNGLHYSAKQFYSFGSFHVFWLQAA